jgi:hypothetical protein
MKTVTYGRKKFYNIDFRPISKGEEIFLVKILQNFFLHHQQLGKNKLERLSVTNYLGFFAKNIDTPLHQ